MLIPLGPVAVFGASNFPFAYSVAGGDTASAFAAGCPVVVKAHPAHPGTSEMTARAIAAAIRKCGIEPGWFSMINGASVDSGMALVKHPAIKAVGFTGSLRGGRALFDAAAARPEPIPVYAEMGSTNPIFILPGAAKERGEAIAAGLQQSVTNGVGQFCTKPGIVVGLNDATTDQFVERASKLIADIAPQTMLHAGIRDLFDKGAKRLGEQPGVKIASKSAVVAETQRTQGGTVVFQSDAETFLKDPVLGEEVFGPATLVVRCKTIQDMERVARALHGQLTATVHCMPDELAEAATLIGILEQKAGRVVYNGFPTGVEDCSSMEHGGPYPATTDSRTTSVGGTAIGRFARPVCYQNFPDLALPLELANANRRTIWRLINDRLTRDPIHGNA
jgi:NADP-dependent aldehyde dehydrogenase